MLKKLELVEKLQQSPEEKEPAAYNKLSELFKTELNLVEERITALYREIVKIKDPKFELVTGDITSALFYPNTTLFLGRSNREIMELKKNVRYYKKGPNVFSELLDKEKS